MEYARSEDAFAMEILLGTTVRSGGILMLLNVVIFAHLTKVFVNSIMLMELPDITLVHVTKVIWVPTVEFRYVLAIVIMQEYAQLQILAHVTEEEWVRTVRLIVDVEDMELVILMEHATVMQASHLTLPPKNANSAAMAKLLQTAMNLIS